MATFTMYLHEVLDAQSPDTADPSIIGLDTYPIWDEGYRDELNHKILMRYWNREIGFETPLMFTHHVKRLMGEIMPYYNQLAKTTLWDFDPFITMDVENTSTSDMEQTAESKSTDTTTADTEETGVEESESASNQKSGNESESIASEHPQTQLQGYEDYATASNRSQSASQSQSDTTGRGESQRTSTTTGDGESETTGNTRNTASSADRQTGFTGSRSQLLQEYRDTIIGVDNQILAELEVLFMGVWDNDDDYTRLQPSWFDPYPPIF